MLLGEMIKVKGTGKGAEMVDVIAKRAVREEKIRVHNARYCRERCLAGRGKIKGKVCGIGRIVGEACIENLGML